MDVDRIGLFYGSTGGNTRRVAELIRDAFAAEAVVELHDVRGATDEDFAPYDFLIFGAPTWHGGELQDDWEAFVSHLDAADLSGKTVALYGLGDQKAYPDAFLDALGTLYEHVKRRGANIIGRWPTNGYAFTHSSAVIDGAVTDAAVEDAAVEDGAFIGLALDEENQPDLTPARVTKWVKRLRLEMEA